MASRWISGAVLVAAVAALAFILLRPDQSREGKTSEPGRARPGNGPEETRGLRPVRSRDAARRLDREYEVSGQLRFLRPGGGKPFVTVHRLANPSGEFFRLNRLDEPARQALASLHGKHVRIISERFGLGRGERWEVLDFELVAEQFLLEGRIVRAQPESSVPQMIYSLEANGGRRIFLAIDNGEAEVLCRAQRRVRLAGRFMQGGHKNFIPYYQVSEVEVVK